MKTICVPLAGALALLATPALAAGICTPADKAKLALAAQGFGLNRLPRACMVQGNKAIIARLDQDTTLKVTRATAWQAEIRFAYATVLQLDTDCRPAAGKGCLSDYFVGATLASDGRQTQIWADETGRERRVPFTGTFVIETLAAEMQP
jgi:hypothetical protein